LSQPPIGLPVGGDWTGRTVARAEIDRSPDAWWRQGLPTGVFFEWKIATSNCAAGTRYGPTKNWAARAGTIPPLTADGAIDGRQP
jgi:hypothetical protein